MRYSDPSSKSKLFANMATRDPSSNLFGTGKTVLKIKFYKAFPNRKILFYFKLFHLQKKFYLFELTPPLGTFGASDLEDLDHRTNSDTENQDCWNFPKPLSFFEAFLYIPWRSLLKTCHLLIKMNNWRNDLGPTGIKLVSFFP